MGGAAKAGLVLGGVIGLYLVGIFIEKATGQLDDPKPAGAAVAKAEQPAVAAQPAPAPSPVAVTPEPAKLRLGDEFARRLDATNRQCSDGMAAWMERLRTGGAEFLLNPPDDFVADSRSVEQTCTEAVRAVNKFTLPARVSQSLADRTRGDCSRVTMASLMPVIGVSRMATTEGFDIANLNALVDQSATYRDAMKDKCIADMGELDHS